MVLKHYVNFLFQIFKIVALNVLSLVSKILILARKCKVGHLDNLTADFSHFGCFQSGLLRNEIFWLQKLKENFNFPFGYIQNLYDITPVDNTGWNIGLIVTHMWGAKEIFRRTLSLNFLWNFGHFIDPFNLVFYSYLKSIEIFKIGPKLTFLQYFFHGTIFSRKNLIFLWK